MLLLWEVAARLQLPVFPCGADKRPFGHTNGFKDAETDPRKIRALFLRYPKASLIGVATGAISGIDILDIDSAKHKEAGIWLRAMGVPETRSHQTQSGGQHFLFQHHEGKAGSTGYPRLGVDVRADGGYMIWWPSAGFAVRNLPIAPWPRKFLDAVTRPARPALNPKDVQPVTEPRLISLVRIVGQAGEGQRNSLLFWASCRLGEWISAGQLQRRYAEQIMLLAAQNCGLDAQSAGRTIASAFKRTVR